jgi:hypothetical protein
MQTVRNGERSEIFMLYMTKGPVRSRFKIERSTLHQEHKPINFLIEQIINYRNHKLNVTNDLIFDCKN